MVQKFLKNTRISGMDLVDSMASSNFHRSILFTLDLSRLVLASKSKKANLPSSLLPPFLPISAAARSVAKQKERTDLHTGYATALCSPPRCGGEKTHVCGVPCAGVCVGVGRTRKARPQRFKDSTPGAAGGNLNRNTLEQVLIRGFERIPDRRSLRFSAGGIASAPLNRQ